MGRYFVARKAGIPPASRQPNGLFRSRGPSDRPFRGTGRSDYNPAKRSRHDLFKTLLAAGRPLRRGECSDAYFNDERNARSVKNRFSVVPCPAADESLTL